MSLTLMIYLAGVVEGVNSVLSFLLFGIAFAVVATFMMWLFHVGGEFKEDVVLRQTGLRGLKISVASFIFLGLVNSLFPAKETMWLMAGAYYGEKAIASEEFKRINEKVFKLIEKKLEELAEEKKKEE